MFSPREKQTLELICETLIPALVAEGDEDGALFAHNAESLHVADAVEETLAETASERNRRDLKLVLWLWEIGLFNRITTGDGRPFSEMPRAAREAFLLAWANSPFEAARRAFQGVKRLALFAHYATMPDDQPNPTWAALRYDPPPPPPDDAPNPIQPLAIREDTTLTADVLVIGSGAGGGVVAGELSAAGFDVIVAEKGGNHAGPDFNGREAEGFRKLFEKRGALTSADTAIAIQAGSTLGGGTTVNWSASFRTPEYVLDEWARDYGFEGANGPYFQRSLTAVSRRVNVNTDESDVNGSNAMLARGCQALGHDLHPVPRNVKGCQGCHYCEFGCPFGAKQSTLRTYLQDAHERGARIIVRAHVDRVLHSGGRTTGAVMTVMGDDVHTVTVRAKAVVVAAGSIHTPALLRRSGLTNPHIGANLRLHPVTAVFSRFNQPVNPWAGVPMSRYSKQHIDLDGRGYGVWLEAAPVHPGLSASSFPWAGARAHKRLMQHIRQTANIIALVRDYYGGHIKLDRAGQPVIHYRLHPYDAEHLMVGLIQALQVHRAAGAQEISTTHNDPLIYRKGNFATFLGDVRRRGLAPNAVALFSAHQMGSCRIGGSSLVGAVNPTGETYEVKDLFVADSSVFPTAAGINPMISIMGTAHYIAQHIKSRL